MTFLQSELDNHVLVITLNRIDKRNAFDDTLLLALQAQLDEAINNPEVRVILLGANGPYFSAGADLGWMKRMQGYSEEENINDAMILGRLMHSLYRCPKPTLAVVQGSVFGGGIGLIAACDLAFAADSVQFCFSEVTLGLIPAVISPYIIEAMGPRAAKHLFMSGERFDALEAKRLQLIQHCLTADDLWPFALTYAKRLSQLPPEALRDCKSLVRDIAHQPIDEQLVQKTAVLIAKKRVSEEGQACLKKF